MHLGDSGVAYSQWVRHGEHTWPASGQAQICFIKCSSSMHCCDGTEIMFFTNVSNSFACSGQPSSHLSATCPLRYYPHTRSILTDGVSSHAEPVAVFLFNFVQVDFGVIVGEIFHIHCPEKSPQK